MLMYMTLNDNYQKLFVNLYFQPKMTNHPFYKVLRLQQMDQKLQFIQIILLFKLINVPFCRSVTNAFLAKIRKKMMPLKFHCMKEV